MVTKFLLLGGTLNVREVVQARRQVEITYNLSMTVSNFISYQLITVRCQSAKG